MTQVSARRHSSAHVPTGLSRLDRFALSMTEPVNVKRWYAAVAAICGAMTGATIWVLVDVMPEGSDIAGTVEFYAKYNTLLRGISALLALLFVVGVFWSATFFGMLWTADTSRNRVYAWSAIFSDILVMALFFAEAGLFAGTVLLSGNTPDSIVHALHVAVLVSAALLGPVWIPMALAALLISRRSGLFPVWLNKVCIAVIVIDLCTLTGVFTLSGPLNGENGLIGAFSGVFGPIVWVGAVIAWEVVEWARYRATVVAVPPAATDPVAS